MVSPRGVAVAEDAAGTGRPRRWSPPHLRPRETAVAAQSLAVPLKEQGACRLGKGRLPAADGPRVVMVRRRDGVVGRVWEGGCPALLPCAAVVYEIQGCASSWTHKRVGAPPCPGSQLHKSRESRFRGPLRPESRSGARPQHGVDPTTMSTDHSPPRTTHSVGRRLPALLSVPSCCCPASHCAVPTP